MTGRTRSHTRDSRCDFHLTTTACPVRSRSATFRRGCDLILYGVGVAISGRRYTILTLDLVSTVGFPLLITSNSTTIDGQVNQLPVEQGGPNHADGEPQNQPGRRDRSAITGPSGSLVTVTRISGGRTTPVRCRSCTGCDTCSTTRKLLSGLLNHLKRITRCSDLRRTAHALHSRCSELSPFTPEDGPLARTTAQV